MRVLHIVPRVAAQASGPSLSVVRLCQALKALGTHVQLRVLDPLPDQDLGIDVQAYPCSRFPGGWRLGWSPGMRRALFQMTNGVDIIHNHSLWMMPNVYCQEAAASTGARLICSPRGTLSEWALRRSRFRKRLVWWYGQRRALFGAHGLHATSEMEREDLRRVGLTQPVTVIPNGVDVPGESGWERAGQSPRSLLFLGRLHPTKGVDLLLEAWGVLQPRYPEWELLVAGPLDSYGNQMRQAAKERGLERVQFLGEVAGETKAELLTTADLFVLPTHSENFGLAVAEALAHGTPAVVTRGAPWEGLESEGCGWWIERSLESLVDTLGQAMAVDAASLGRMGDRGRQWMARDFSWERQAERMMDFYRSLLNREHGAVVRTG